MSSAVLSSRNAVLNSQAVGYAREDFGGQTAYLRVTPDRPMVRRPSRRGPDSGAVRYRDAHVRVSQAEHHGAEGDVGWRTVLATVLVTAGILLGFGVVAHAVTASGMGSLSGATEVVQVGSGDTLTDVAERVAPGLPAQQVIERIMDLNAMSTSSIAPGQSLVVPASLP